MKDSWNLLEFVSPHHKDFNVVDLDLDFNDS